MSKREAVPKHSLPPQKQILSYMGRFINCPYAPDTEPPRLFSARYFAMRPLFLFIQVHGGVGVQIQPAPPSGQVFIVALGADHGAVVAA